MSPDGVDTHWRHPFDPPLLSTMLTEFCGVTAEGWDEALDEQSANCIATVSLIWPHTHLLP